MPLILHVPDKLWDDPCKPSEKAALLHMYAFISAKVSVFKSHKDIAQDIGWSVRKTSHILKRLEDLGAINGFSPEQSRIKRYTPSTPRVQSDALIETNNAEDSPAQLAANKALHQVAELTISLQASRSLIADLQAKFADIEAKIAEQDAKKVTPKEPPQDDADIPQPTAKQDAKSTPMPASDPKPIQTPRPDPELLHDGPALLTTWLKPKGRSRGKLGKQLGVSQPTVSKWANGTNKPKRQYADAIQAITGVPVTAWGFEPATAPVDNIRTTYDKRRSADGPFVLIIDLWRDLGEPDRDAFLAVLQGEVNARRASVSAQNPQAQLGADAWAVLEKRGDTWGSINLRPEVRS